MIIILQVQVACAECGNTTAGGLHFSDNIDSKRLQEKAERNGWQFMQDGRPLCRNCKPGGSGMFKAIREAVSNER